MCVVPVVPIRLFAIVAPMVRKYERAHRYLVSIVSKICVAGNVSMAIV